MLTYYNNYIVTLKIVILHFWLASGVSDVDQLKTIIGEVERLHSNNNAEDKRKIHKLLQECVQVLLDHRLFYVQELFQITF